ncbi:FixH family protein [Dichotomicrobium thermohalophilum]|uniref:Nitrogen fixation protein FixH n=1 Tax=Dichotomicrobium thermohalophilum TaxID=933063 RepID=A0A397PE69_9HYPH|nr:FixH family protein [Dichotomicrobium thermohalophilum]RIA47806.1 nitrogen fixation protein FixH [Dichotomicrobium thermohalophilum]
MTIRSEDGGRPITGRTVLYILVGFFGVMLVANGIFTYLAVSTFNGLVTEGSYRKGLEYDERLAAEARQERLGWNADLQLAERGGQLRFKLEGDDGRPVSGRLVRVRMGRPATDKFDRTILLNETSPGLYTRDISLPGAGNWLASLEVLEGYDEAKSVVYRMKKRLWLKPGT